MSNERQLRTSYSKIFLQLFYWPNTNLQILQVRSTFTPAYVPFPSCEARDGRKEKARYPFHSPMDQLADANSPTYKIE